VESLPETWPLLFLHDIHNAVKVIKEIESETLSAGPQLFFMKYISLFFWVKKYNASDLFYSFYLLLFSPSLHSFNSLLFRSPLFSSWRLIQRFVCSALSSAHQNTST